MFNSSSVLLDFPKSLPPEVDENYAGHWILVSPEDVAKCEFQQLYVLTCCVVIERAVWCSRYGVVLISNHVTVPMCAVFAYSSRVTPMTAVRGALDEEFRSTGRLVTLGSFSIHWLMALYAYLCFLLCLASSSLRVKLIPQSVHTYGRTPVCVR